MLGGQTVFNPRKCGEPCTVFLNYAPKESSLTTGQRLQKSGAFHQENTKVFGLSKAALKANVLPVPHPKEQTTIATILSDMDENIAAVEAKLAKTSQLKRGMMQQLLTGRIRLI